jgi:hypothetical protein
MVVCNRAKVPVSILRSRQDADRNLGTVIICKDPDDSSNIPELPNVLNDVTSIDFMAHNVLRGRSLILQ